MSEYSIIVPVYNGEKYLKKCIKSILNQTFDDFELIIVNDGSTDKSLAICEYFKKTDSRVKIISIRNSGCIEARKVGIINSSSKYILFVDCDDWINKNMLLIYNNEIGDADVLVSNTQRVMGNIGIIRRKTVNRYFDKNRILIGDEIKNEIIVAYLYGHPFPANLWGKVYKRELLVNNRKFIKYIHFFGEDLYYNMDIFLHTDKVKIITDILYYYRYGGNTSKYMSYLFKDSIEGYNIQKEVINTYFEDKTLFNGISIMLLNTFKTCLMNIFMSDLHEGQIKEQLKFYVDTKEIQEAIDNRGAIEYFDKDYLVAIKEKNIDYIYSYGLQQYKSTRYKRIIKKIFNCI